jgi:tetratricopeptide (TPR) repeat protein
VSPVERQPETIVAASAEAGEAKLSVATATLESGDLDEALKIYQDLIESAHGLDQIIESLSGNLARFGSQVAIHEVLGDAYARNGQLNRALASYQMALKQLES